ncbi:MAG: undecaprenyldiphospho-muramoylpentapeptide beta-N-acetylglucosaminyltransferase [Burkholderiales bacterium]|jgi:UDP-N-acetylglucosamine--N-acetylmuramyl-(pentapeptide) pyrophosphoryl-undecaprenol N-acetylglucosamine transferase|nr:undecaprenyldiphospho-muramoylpentapeptide beta-N-acetylglucosaminyltransferase [Burkholderiales bacterium]
MSRTILVMAGGTGGHIFPALAVADVLRDRGWRVVWLGARGGMEERLVPQRGYAAEWIRFGGVRGKGWLRKLLLPAALLVAFWQSAAAILRHRPHVVLGMGGYASFPGGMMAALLGRPLLIHEQNAVPGLANRVLAGVADRVLSAFPDAFEGRVDVIWSGNPVRSDIVSLPPPEARFANRSGPLRLLVIGGSLGAKALNETVPQALALMAAGERPRVVHQSGAAHAEQLRESYRAAGVEAEVPAFIDDMAARYGAADLLVCRAGATTVTELAVAGVGSILVPFPHAVDDHQTRNARYLADRGAALLMPQKDLTPRRLADVLRGLTREKLLEMARAARAAGKPDAATRVADYCMELAPA